MLAPSINMQTDMMGVREKEEERESFTAQQAWLHPSSSLPPISPVKAKKEKREERREKRG